ncbi:MAG: DUF86 domain-containing protein [Oscillospiraceae bacterium]|nr:DUF86 domain-containing protein [Oscillospiraceae bacterium]
MNDRDFAYFESMYMFAKRVERRIEGVSLELFLEDEDIQDLVLFAIGHIGEKANSISLEERERHHNIFWNELIGIRNRIFHSYEDVNMQIVYEAATEHIPKLILQLKSIIGAG